MQFTVLASPFASFSFNETCIGDTTFFDDLSDPIAGSIVDWDWNFGDSFGSSNQSEPAYLYSLVDTFEVELIVTGSNTCFDDTSVTLVVHPLPTPVFTHPLVSCPDSVVQFTLDTIDGVSYAWDFGDGNTGVGVNPTNIYTSSGIYTVRLIVESAFGCIDSFSSQIEIALSPDASFLINPDEGCGPLEVVINYAPASPSLDFDYVWNFGNGDPLLTNAIPSNPYIYQPAANGRDTFYIIELFVQSPICQEIDIHRDTVYVKSPPLSQVNPDVLSGCSPLSVNFTNNNFSNVDSIFVYFEDGTQETYLGTADFTATFFNLSNVNIVDTIIVVSVNECGIDSQEILITIFPNTVTAGLSLSDAQVCPGEPFTIFNNSVGNAYTYYDFGQGVNPLNTPVQSFSYVYDNPGTYTITQYVYSSDSCSFDVDAVQIEVFEGSAAGFSFSQFNAECSGSIEVSFQNNSVNGNSYLWYFGDGDSSNLADPIHVYPEAGLYEVQLISQSADGCLDTLIEPIRVEYADNNLYVPNALSPLLGTDEVRIFKPKGTCLKEYKISIYNIWGEIVWYSDLLEDGSPAEAWNGTHIETGILLPQDVYIWEIDAVFENNEVWRGKSYEKRRKNIGSVTLIK
jgi:PKD repeat protein